MLTAHKIELYPFLDKDNQLYYQKITKTESPELYVKYGLSVKSNQVVLYITQLLYCNFVIMSNAINKLDIKIKAIHKYLATRSNIFDIVNANPRDQQGDKLAESPDNDNIPVSF